MSFKAERKSPSIAYAPSTALYAKTSTFNFTLATQGCPSFRLSTQYPILGRACDETRRSRLCGGSHACD